MKHHSTGSLLHNQQHNSRMLITNKARGMLNYQIDIMLCVKVQPESPGVAADGTCSTNITNHRYHSHSKSCLRAGDEHF